MTLFRSNIPVLDKAVTDYCNYLEKLYILPQGHYALAGGAIRSIFDKTRLKDFDIYYLGENFDTGKIPDYTRVTLENTSCSIEIVTPSLLKFSSIPVQIMTYRYDPDFKTRVTKITSGIVPECNATTFATSPFEIINSFDLTISKGFVEFTISARGNISIDSIFVAPECLVDIALRQLRHAEILNVPTQLTTLKRFAKFISLGYSCDEDFFTDWRKRLTQNPYLLVLSYD